jgi:hypothetical protein
MLSCHTYDTEQVEEQGITDSPWGRGLLVWMLGVYLAYVMYDASMRASAIVSSLVCRATGETVLDFISSEARTRGARLMAAEEAQAAAVAGDAAATATAAEGQDDQHAQCVCCLDAPATFVLQGCGHAVACLPCRRRLVYQQLKMASQQRVLRGLGRRAPAPMWSLSDAELGAATVRCPMCRSTGKLVQVAAARQ